MYIGLHVKYALFCEILMKFEFYGQFFFSKNKQTNIKFHENPPNGSRFVPCSQTGRKTDVTKLIVAFRTFVNALKNREECVYLRNLLVTENFVTFMLRIQYQKQMINLLVTENFPYILA